MGCYTAGEGATHHAGCECHEARRDEVIAKLLAAIDAHRADNLRIYSTDDLHDNTLYAVADAVREGE
jgi:hypothetical protein